MSPYLEKWLLRASPRGVFKTSVSLKEGATLFEGAKLSQKSNDNWVGCVLGGVIEVAP